MIISANGRSRSERTMAELEKGLAQELEHLSCEERETFELMLEEFRNEQEEEGLAELIGNAEWKTTPCDVETFVKDPYFLGVTCENLYARLLADMVEVFDGGYSEAVLTGSIGWGKTFFASIGICRILYELSCMKNPQASFGLASQSGIAITNMSVTESLAIKVVFENIATKIKCSPYFQENFPFAATRKELRFPNSIWVAARSSTDTSALGLNTIAGIVDESNFFAKSANANASNVDLAESIYATMRRRMKSRFERQGKLPGMLFVVSSKRTNDDFTARRIINAANDPTVFVRDYALWDVKPEDYFSVGKFYVLVGNDKVSSKILDPGEERQFLENPQEGTIVFPVPEDFRMDFQTDLEGAIRDIGGIATVSVNPYIQRRDTITAACNSQRSHPFSELIYDPSRKGIFMWDRMVSARSERAPGGITETVNRPRLNPMAPRAVHIDPSLRGDATGLVMAHIGGWKDVVRRADDGQKFMERAPMYVVDLALRIIPPMGGEIVLAELRHLIYDLTRHGYMITGVSLDSYQSADTIQQMKSQGYRSEILSVDTSPDPYDNLKTAFYEGRVDMYPYPPLISELEALQEDRRGKKRKIDHPVRGSKDVSDALAGVLFQLRKYALEQPLPMLQSMNPDSDPWMSAAFQSRGAPVVSMPTMPTAGSNSDILPPFIGSGFR